MKKIIFYLILVSCLLSLVSIANAQSDDLGLSVYPQIFEMDVFPGQEVEQEIFLTNIGQMALPVNVELSDFSAEENSGEMFFDDSMNDPIISSKTWFEIENKNLILEPDEKRKINFKIKVPENAEPGGHYSVMFFKPQIPSFYFKAGQPKTVPVVGVLFLLSVSNLSLEPVVSDNLVEVAEFSIPETERLLGVEKVFANISGLIPGVGVAQASVVDKTPEKFMLKIKNNDIYHHKIEGRAFIYNFFGKMVGEIEIKKTTVLPGKVREFPVDVQIDTPAILEWLPGSISFFLAQNTQLGKYKVVLDLNDEKNQVELLQSIAFWSIPWKITLVLAIFLAIFVLLRKRIWKATQIIFKNERAV